jgi:hypothetical protein
MPSGYRLPQPDRYRQVQHVRQPPGGNQIHLLRDNQGRQLNGKSSYSITFPKGELPPGKGFWSVTLYNDVHLFNPNQLGRYSLGTKSKNLKYGTDGSLTLYAGAKSPGKDKESNWLPAPPEGTFSLYIRAYWADRAILDRQWQPPEVRLTEGVGGRALQ